MLLHKYFVVFQKSIEKLENYGYTDSVEIKEEIRPNKQAVIKAKIVLVNRSILHIKEYIDAKYTMQKLSYIRALARGLADSIITICLTLKGLDKGNSIGRGEMIWKQQPLKTIC